MLHAQIKVVFDQDSDTKGGNKVAVISGAFPMSAHDFTPEPAFPKGSKTIIDAINRDVPICASNIFCLSTAPKRADTL